MNRWTARPGPCPRRALAIALMAVVAAALTACGAAGMPQPHANLPNERLGLPAPSILAGRSSSDSLGYILGSEASPDLPRFAAPASAATLRFLPKASGSPSLDNCAYALFRTPVEDSGPLRWTPTWRVAPAAGHAYLGLGNIAEDRWDWRLLEDPGAALTVENGADYISGAGDVLLALLLVPGAGQAELDYFTLRTSPLSGWRFAEIHTDLLEGDDDFTVRGVQAAVVAGRPALLFGIGNTTDFSNKQYLAVSSTSTGAASADWTVRELPAATQSRDDVSLAEVGGGYAITCVVDNDETALEELRYFYATDPDAPFSDELVATAVDLARPRIAEIGGAPGIVFGRRDVTTGSLYPPHYAGADTAGGGNWSVTAVDPAGEVSISISDTFAPPLQFEGRPLLGYYDYNTGQFAVAAGGVAVPQQTADWTVLPLGDGSDNLLYATTVAGRPVFAAHEYVAFAPDETKLWTYTLTGAAPDSVESWTPAAYDDLGLGLGVVLGVIGLGTDTAFLEKEGGAPLTLWRSAAPGNTPADWQTAVTEVAPEQGNYSMLAVEGQPAYARQSYFHAGFGAEERTYTHLTWAVYVE